MSMMSTATLGKKSVRWSIGISVLLILAGFPFEAVESFHPLSNDERASLLAKTRQAAATGRFEPFKTSSIFDGTAENPQWLGEEPPEIRELMPA